MRTIGSSRTQMAATSNSILPKVVMETNRFGSTKTPISLMAVSHQIVDCCNIQRHPKPPPSSKIFRRAQKTLSLSTPPAAIGSNTCSTAQPISPPSMPPKLFPCDPMATAKSWHGSKSRSPNTTPALPPTSE